MRFYSKLDKGEKTMKQLKKSRDKWLCGIIGGIAEYFGWDKDMSRLFFGVIIASGVGTPLILYGILYFMMPEAD